MMPNEVKLLLHERAGRVHVHGDFADTAIAGARRVRTRRAVTAAATAALAVAISFGLAMRDFGPNRGTPATPTSESTSRVALPAPPLKTATVRVGAPAGPMPLPYIQAGVLHLSGRTVRISTGQDDRLLLFGTLSNGGVVYRVAGPDPALPSLDAGPLTFLDRAGQVVTQQSGVAQTDVVGPGDRVTAIADSGELVVFDGGGKVVGRLESMGASQSTSRAAELGPDLVANLAGHEDPTTRVGSLATGRSAYLAVTRGRADAGEAPLTLHDERALLVQGSVKPAAGGVSCKYLDNYLTGEPLRTWCDDTRPIGFFPDGDWMYGLYWGRPGVWVARTDDGAPLLEIRTDGATQDRFTEELPAPSPDGTALLVVLAAEDGQTVTSSCAIATGACQVLSDRLEAPGRGLLALPDNWGRQQPSGTS